MRTQAEKFLTKRSKQKDNLVITKEEAIRGLVDFAKEMKREWEFIEQQKRGLAW